MSIIGIFGIVMALSGASLIAYVVGSSSKNDDNVSKNYRETEKPHFEHGLYHQNQFTIKKKTSIWKSLLKALAIFIVGIFAYRWWIKRKKNGTSTTTK